MRLTEMLEGMETEMHLSRGLPETEITGITADSRAVRPGFLFAALDGTNARGSDFIADALARGAGAVLADGKAVAGNDAATGSEAAFVESANPRRAYALLAARFYHGQPQTVAAVTGTNGKTSVVHFLRLIWEQTGARAASLGTLGLVGAGAGAGATHTTPEPASLHQTLAEIAAAGTSHLAMEASSHGLAQHRLDGVRVKAAGFTNISRDHLDYHGTMQSYLAAKTRLFLELLQQDGTAVINTDSAEGRLLNSECGKRKVKTITIGSNDDADIRIVSLAPDAGGQKMEISIGGNIRRVSLPLAGTFQAENALMALGLAVATGIDGEKAIGALESLEPVPGRMELAGNINSASVYVDYAHTPDALRVVLKNLRPHCQGRLAVVFGAGGDRDPGKREQMGRVAHELADRVYVTDDNPRSEDPAIIRKMIMTAVPEAEEIPDRGAAINTAVKSLAPGDVLLIAGKGHETVQIINGNSTPFDDRVEARKAIAGVQQ